MIGKLGMPEMLVLPFIALLVFGPRKIGELGKGLGEGIRGLKSALREAKKNPANKGERRTWTSAK
jgi:sec-independent protein translocase protein TatA